jgi:hypothetical protein
MDLEALEEAREKLKSKAWAVKQTIDDVQWTTYYNGGGNCKKRSTAFEGRSLNPILATCYQ